MDFSDDLAPREEPVTNLFGKDYTLREAGEGDVSQWRSMHLKGMQFGPDGKPVSVGSGIVDSEAFIVSRCLWQGDKLVPLSVVKGWPARIVKRLHERAVQISDLSEKPATKEQVEAEIAKLQRQLLELEGNGDGTSTSSSA